ncbi:hypothetical protein V8G54_011675 [Vigna mungo]|uniref:Tf2-1-like SH3-like domain-containing protein n=1 Tax=Vigna mungo TaxID=3915 RepID=A0AAQ3RZU5_VIGMU
MRRGPLEFEAGDHVFLCGKAILAKKLSPRYLGPYQISRRIGPVAYEIVMPPQLANLHPLRKYVPDPSHVLEADIVQVKEDLSIEMQLVKVDERLAKRLDGKATRLIKVIWDNRTGDSTWEKEEEMKKSYTHLFFAGIEKARGILLNVILWNHRGAHPIKGERDEEKGQQREVGGVTQTNIEQKPQIRIGSNSEIAPPKLIFVRVDDEGTREMVAHSGFLSESCRSDDGDGRRLKRGGWRDDGEVRRTKVMAARDLEWLRLRSPVDNHGCAHGGEDEDGGRGVHGVWTRTKVLWWWLAAWLNGGARGDPNGCDGGGPMLGFGGEEKTRGRQRRENGYDGGKALQVWQRLYASVLHETDVVAALYKVVNQRSRREGRILFLLRVCMQPRRIMSPYLRFCHCNLIGSG